MGAQTKQQPGAAARRGDDREITTLIESARHRIEPFLPEGVSVERVAAAVYLATKQNPMILRCTPESVVRAVAKTQQWGLEIGETAHLVPFRTKVKVSGGGEELRDVCVPIADYKGLAQLMIASGAVRFVEARCVYEGDEFRYSQGLNAELYHVPVSDPSERGQLRGAYCILRLPFGQAAWEFMPIADIDEIRQKHSKQWKTGACPPWYAKKTVVRQIAKLLPKSPRLAKALSVLNDDRAIEFDEGALASDPELGSA